MLLSRVRIRPNRILCASLALLLLVATASEPVATPASAAPAADHDDQTRAFLSRLLDEINQRRELAGTPPLAFLPGATAALDDFLAQTMPEMAWPGPCMHHLVGGEYSWSYVRARGFSGEFRGEVLACPGPEPYWTPGRTADQWWSSPGHFEILYGDPNANALACSAVGVRGGPSSNGGKGKQKGGGQTSDAASAVLCVTVYDVVATAGGTAAEQAALQLAAPDLSEAEWEAETETQSDAAWETESETESEAEQESGAELVSETVPDEAVEDEGEALATDGDTEPVAADSEADVSPGPE